MTWPINTDSQKIKQNISNLTIIWKGQLKFMLWRQKTTAKYFINIIILFNLILQRLPFSVLN